MRKLLLAVFSLSVFVSSAGVLRAQSGRNRSVPTENSGDAYMNELAQRTGGRMYRGNSVVNISQAFEWVAEELRRQYSLGYYPKAAGKGGERRQIRVEVSQPNLAVQARDSYVYSQKKSEDKQEGGAQPKDSDEQRRHLSGSL